MLASWVLKLYSVLWVCDSQETHCLHFVEYDFVWSGRILAAEEHTVSILWVATSSSLVGGC